MQDIASGTETSYRLHRLEISSTKDPNQYQYFVNKYSSTRLNRILALDDLLTNRSPSNAS